MPRQTDYTDELASEICIKLMEGKSLRAACADKGMPCFQTVLRWVDEDRCGFASKYARAREVQAGFYAEEQIEIADTDDNPTKARNRMLARQWYASKMDRARFGDKTTTELTGKDGGAIEVKNLDDAALEARVAALMAQVKP